MDPTIGTSGVDGSGYIPSINNNSLPQVVEENGEVSQESSSHELTIGELLKANPHLKECFNKLEEVLSDPGLTTDNVFSMQALFNSLIELGQTLAMIATAYADTLTKLTEKMNAYSQEMTEIPIVTKEQAGGDQTAAAFKTQLFSNMLEALKANKGMEEDQAKKIQTMLQQLKDANQSANDFLGAFLDLFRGISQKINR